MNTLVPTARYTMICEFRGGTYVAQVFADDEADAIRQWAADVRATKPIPRSSRLVARNILQNLRPDEGWPVPLNGLVGVWYCAASLGGSLIELNIVLSR